MGLLVADAALAGRLPDPPLISSAIPAGERTDGGLRIFFRTVEVPLLTGLTGCQTFVRGALNVIVVVFAIEVLRSGGGAVGLLLGGIGVGGMLGMPVALSLAGRDRLYRSFGIGLALWGIPLALVAAAGNLPASSNLVVVVVLFAVVGLGNDLVDVGWLTGIPRAVPDHLLAKVLGVFESVLQVSMALGAIAGGILLSQMDAGRALVAVGLFLPVIALLASPLLRSLDARLEHRDQEIDLLRRQPLFAQLPMTALDHLATRLVPAEFPAEAVIMREGDPGDGYVLIAGGTVAIRRGGADVAVLGRGDAFGEIALVRDTVRTATAVASTGVSALILDRDGFVAALGCFPHARLAAEAVADARST